MYIDGDGDMAHEFYEQVNGRFKRVTTGLRPQVGRVSMVVGQTSAWGLRVLGDSVSSDSFAFAIIGTGSTRHPADKQRLSSCDSGG